MGRGQTDATVPSARTREQELAEREADKRGTAGQEGTIGDRYEMPSGEGSEPVKIGSVTLRKSGLVKFERVYTPNASDYQLVIEDGTVLNSIHEIVREVHAEAYRIKLKKQQAG